ncbi:hypothetical protein A8W25_06790 [Streptomyces sp. ERV7]|nr:hypothetical protein A8W25_06790 [Streptomyces sp. ERV7]
MFLSRVAENSMRWPPGSTCFSSAVTCGMKPMSAIWSASSSTVVRTWPSTQSPRSMRSLRRPGVATSTSAPRRSAFACLVSESPPTTVVSRKLTAVAYGVSASVTCWASSRVGTSTMASGAFGSARRPAVRARSARPKARVLPEPVRPRPRMSRPASEFGSVAAWIGNGSVTPCAASVLRSAAGMSRSANAATAGSAGVTVSGNVNSPCGCTVRPRAEFAAGLAELEVERLRGFIRVIRKLPSWARWTDSTQAGTRTCAVRAPARDSPKIRRGGCSPPAGPSGPG